MGDHAPKGRASRLTETYVHRGVSVLTTRYKRDQSPTMNSRTICPCPGWESSSASDFPAAQSTNATTMSSRATFSSGCSSWISWAAA